MLLIDQNQLESYAAELSAVKNALEQAYCNADLDRCDSNQFLTVILALEALAAKIEQGKD